ncbi:MAG: hypothetical protein ACREPK_10135 [Rhodanobacteraceae bacterium]
MFNGTFFIVAIVAIGCATGIINHYLRLKATRPHEDPGHQNRIDALEHRVKTLERIVTDKGYDLKREFEKL